MLDSEIVETASSAPDNSAKNNLAARIGGAILILTTLYICYFSHLGAIGFVGPDEPRYAWIARDMAETGDWVTPRLYGKPWFEKPVLYYWASERDLRIARHACAGLAGAASLRGGDRSLDAASASDHCRNDWFLSCRRHGHALQRHAHDCD